MVASQRLQDSPNQLALSFLHFIVHFEVPQEAPERYEYLQDFIAAWVDGSDPMNNPLPECCGDFGSFMAVVAWIVNMYHTSSSLREYTPPGKTFSTKRTYHRRLKGVFDRSRQSWIMDRTSWEEAIRNKMQYGTIYRPRAAPTK